MTVTALTINRTVYDYIQKFARSKSLITYGAVAKLIGLDMGRADHRNQLSVILGEISNYEVSKGWPMLSPTRPPHRTRTGNTIAPLTASCAASPRPSWPAAFGTWDNGELFVAVFTPNQPMRVRRVDADVDPDPAHTAEERARSRWLKK